MLEKLELCMLVFFVPMLVLYYVYNKDGFSEGKNIFKKAYMTISPWNIEGEKFWIFAVASILAYLLLPKSKWMYPVFVYLLTCVINQYMMVIARLDNDWCALNDISSAYRRKVRDNTGIDFFDPKLIKEGDQYAMKRMETLSCIVNIGSFLLAIAFVMDVTNMMKGVLFAISIITFVVNFVNEFTGVWSLLLEKNTYNPEDLMFLYLHPIVMLIFIVVTFFIK